MWSQSNLVWLLSIIVTIATLQLTPRVHATPVKLDFFTTTLAPHTNQSDWNILQIKYVPDTLYEVIVVFFFALTIMVIIWIGQRIRQRGAYKFDVYLYVGSNEHFCPIWVRSFALEPSTYTFSAQTYIQTLNMHGFIRPYLSIIWPSLKIHSTMTNEHYQLPKSIRVSWMQMWHLSKLLSQPYRCILVSDFEGHRSIIQLPTCDSAPAYEGQGQGQPSQEMVVPTTSSIYPKLN